MLYFWAIPVAVAIAISFPANDFPTLDNLESQPFTAASISDRGCIPATSMNDIREEDTIYRRDQMCREEQTYKQTSREHSGVTTQPPLDHHTGLKIQNALILMAEDCLLLAEVRR